MSEVPLLDLCPTLYVSETDNSRVGDFGCNSAQQHSELCIEFKSKSHFISVLHGFIYGGKGEVLQWMLAPLSGLWLAVILSSN